MATSKRIAALLAAAITVLIVSACAAEGERVDACEEGGWCYSDTPYGGYYDGSLATFYCEVFIAREYVVQGEFDISYLPEWVDPSLRDDGKPVIVDLATFEQGRLMDEMSGEFESGFLSPEASDLESVQLRAERDACAEVLDQAVMESIEGPRRDLGEG